MSEPTWASRGRRVVRVTDRIFDVVILTLILLLIAFALFALWDTEQVRFAADPTRYQIYRPTYEDSVSFDELRAINPDVFAWLTVYGTNIDYPVVQGPDNEKYINTNAYGHYSLPGSIFMDAENDRSFRDFNSILYGHHMEKSVMFGDIGCFCEKEYFDMHRYGNLFFDGTDHGLEFFAFVRTTAYNRTLLNAGITGQAARQQYLDWIYENALVSRDIGVTPEDHILLMTTCSAEATNGRDILIARITDTTFENPYATEETPMTGWPYLFEQVEHYRICLIPLALMLVLIALTLLVLSRKRTKKREELPDVLA